MDAQPRLRADRAGIVRPHPGLCRVLGRGTDRPHRLRRPCGGRPDPRAGLLQIAGARRGRARHLRRARRDTDVGGRRRRRDPPVLCRLAALRNGPLPAVHRPRRQRRRRCHVRPPWRCAGDRSQRRARSGAHRLRRLRPGRRRVARLDRPVGRPDRRRRSPDADLSAGASAQRRRRGLAAQRAALLCRESARRVPASAAPPSGATRPCSTACFRCGPRPATASNTPSRATAGPGSRAARRASACCQGTPSRGRPRRCFPALSTAGTASMSSTMATISERRASAALVGTAAAPFGDLVERGELEAALRGLALFMRTLVEQPAALGADFPFPELDTLCADIGRRSAFRLFGGAADLWPAAHDVVVVTEASVQGGHAEIVRDIAEWSTRPVLVVATNLFDPGRTAAALDPRAPQRATDRRARRWPARSAPHVAGAAAQPGGAARPRAVPRARHGGGRRVRRPGQADPVLPPLRPRPVPRLLPAWRDASRSARLGGGSLPPRRRTGGALRLPDLA